MVQFSFLGYVFTNGYTCAVDMCKSCAKYCTCVTKSSVTSPYVANVLNLYDPACTIYWQTKHGVAAHPYFIPAVNMSICTVLCKSNANDNQRISRYIGYI